MNRCECCEYRNSWDCEDGWGRKNNNVFCEDFKLDFNQLREGQKKKIQLILMAEREDEE